MSGFESGDASPLPAPARKRRRVSLHDDSNDSTPRFSSPDELTAPSYNQKKTQETSSAVRRAKVITKPSRSPPPGGLSEDELNTADYYDRARPPRQRGAPPSKAPPQASSPSRSSYRSRSRSRSRSRYPPRSPTHSPSSPSQRALTPRSPSGSRTRSESTPSSARSDTSSSRRNSLSGKVDRHLRLSDDQTPASASASATAPATPHRSPPLRPNYQPYLTLSGHDQAVSQVRFSPDGRWIASASSDGTVKLWDAATGRHMDTLVGHMAGISCVAWSPDGDTLATGSDDKAIRLWDRITARPMISAKGTRGGTVAARPMPPMLGHHNYVMCIAFSPKGNILASGSYDEAVFLWDVRAGRLMRSLPAHSDPVSGIGFSQDGTLVVSCSTDGLIRIWDTYTGQCLRTLVHEENPAVTAACFSPNGRYVLAFNLDNCIRLWDYVSGTVKKTYQGHRNQGFAVGGCFGLLPLDGAPAGPGPASEAAFVASPSEDGDVVLWDVTSKEILQRFSAHPGKVCFWVDVRGDAMVTAGQDGSVRIFRHKGVEAAEAAPAPPEVRVNGSNSNEMSIKVEEDMDVDGP